MFKESNRKLQQTRDLLVELIAELDLVLEDARGARHDKAARDGLHGEPEWVQRTVRQRAALMSVATMLADMRFEGEREPQHEHED